MPSRPAPRRRGWIVVLSFALASPAAARGAVTLDDAVDEIAKIVAAAVKGQDQATVRVARFDNPFDGEKTSGAGLRAKIIDALKKLGIENVVKADLALTGEFAVNEAEDTGAGGKGAKFAAARITYVLKSSRTGKKLLDSETPVAGTDDPKDPPKIVDDPASVAALGGLTVEVPADDPKKADEKVAKAAGSDTKAAATVVLDGNKIRPEAGSKFAVEVLKARPADAKAAPPESAYRSATASLRNGVPYVDIEPEEVYAVVIHNEQPFDVAAKVLIDGLSVYQFSEAKGKRSEFWVIPKAQKNGVIYGWHRRANPDGKDDFDTFLVHEYSKAEDAKSVASEADKGQIFVEFHAAFQGPSDMPADELEPGEKTRATSETIPGPPIRSKVTLVERKIGKFRASITVRYDRAYPDSPP